MGRLNANPEKMNHIKDLDMPVFSNLENSLCSSFNLKTPTRKYPYSHKLQLKPITPIKQDVNKTFSKDYLDEDENNNVSVLSRISNLERSCITFHTLQFYQEKQTQQHIELLRRVAELEKITTKLEKIIACDSKMNTLSTENEMAEDCVIEEMEKLQNVNGVDCKFNSYVANSDITVDSIMNNAFVDNIESISIFNVDSCSPSKILSTGAKRKTKPKKNIERYDGKCDIEFQKVDGELIKNHDCTFIVSKSDSSESLPEPTPEVLMEPDQHFIYKKPCIVCDKLFIGRHTKLLHMISHFKDEIYKDLKEEKRPYTCPISKCTFATNDKGTWALHYGSVHGIIRKYENLFLERNNNNL